MTMNIILGGGIAGLSAAYEAKRLGFETVIFESSPTPGGLLNNFTVDGFRFDSAVHLSFAEEREVREVFDRSDYHRHEPEAVNWDTEQWLRHPVQNNLYPLQASEKVELISGLVNAPPSGDIRNYEDWLIQQYGEPIARRWPMVYTEKYWTLPANQLGTDWVGARVRRADLREVLQGAFSEDTPHGFYAKEMRYPKQGGYRSFIKPMIDEARVIANHEVVRIDVNNRHVYFANGEVTSFDRLISTLPLPELIALMDDVPDDIRQTAASLFATSVDLISVGFSKPNVSPTLWFYIYDRSILAARGYSPNWKSPDAAPEGCSSIQFEIYSSPARPLTHSIEDLKANTRDGIKKMGLADDADILFLHHKRLKYGNVVFDLGMEARRDRVKDYVESCGIALAGRFGEWAYLWSNQSMMSGINAARKIFSPAPPASVAP
ncbi:protoporphyrinogen/coproporphyrinogen oxidase [Methylobacterium sp. J-076]|uniref:protoporphyrinogen/coproporphyrinogen oxidase n=1 Tax=Methylobacterium sp. J-076 TaxID=2836655 RepID=UPI001FBBBE7C|nr:FAD-dependent oxidoreductase [Methylobacterium sp. J-076]MCJ2011959.1 FAD-dependent oxidoreductase [Methylobacterium sp. J-076]